MTLQRELTLVQRNLFLYGFRFGVTMFVGFVTATCFLRTNLHPEGVNAADLYFGAVFFSLIMLMFDGFAEETVTVRFGLGRCWPSPFLTSSTPDLAFMTPFFRHQRTDCMANEHCLKKITGSCPPLCHGTLKCFCSYQLLHTGMAVCGRCCACLGGLNNATTLCILPGLMSFPLLSSACLTPCWLPLYGRALSTTQLDSLLNPAGAPWFYPTMLQVFSSRPSQARQPYASLVYWQCSYLDNSVACRTVNVCTASC